MLFLVTSQPGTGLLGRGAGAGCCVALSMWHPGWSDNGICKLQMTPSPQTLVSWVLLLNIPLVKKKALL